MIRARLLIAALPMAALLLPGCRVLNRDNAQPTPIALAEAEQLQLAEEIRDLEDQIQQIIAGAAQHILDSTDDAEIRRAAAVWRTSVVDRYHAILDPDAPGNSVVAAMIYTNELDDYLREGDGRRLFGKEQPTALDATARIRESLESMAARHLDEPSLALLRTETREAAQKGSIRGVFEEVRLPGRPVEELGKQTFSLLTDIPLSPIRTMQGINKGVGGIQEMPAAAREINKTIEDFPEEMRWQAELFLLELTANDMMTSVVVNFEQLSESSRRLSESSERLSSVAEKLPADIQTLVDETLRQSSEHQEELRRTMGEARALTEEMQQTLAEARAAGEAWNQTARSVGETMGVISDLVRKEGAGGGSGKPFDINDYTRTAGALEAASADVRRTLETLQGLDEKRLAEAAGRVRAEGDLAVESAYRRSIELVDMIFRRALALVLIIFALALAFRLAGLIAARNRPSTKHEG